MPLYPAHWEADVVLRDGRTAQLRPVTPTDAAELVEFYARVSDESKYYRFFAAYPRLSARDVDRLTTVDYDTRVVLLAILAGEIIGLVQYEGLSATEAEVAFLVEDEHQGRGLASILLEHLAAVASEHGIRRFSASVLPSNRHMLAVFRAAGYTVQSRTADEVVSVSFDLSPTEASRAVMQEREHRAEARSVAHLLAPRSVAVAGASRTGRGVGSAALRHLAAAGFTGALSAVHPATDEVCGVPAFPRFRDIPGGADLAVLAVPGPQVASLVADAAAGGALGLVVVSAGFAETGLPAGRAMQSELVRLTRSYGMRLVGPNALGILNTDPEVRLNASLSPLLPPHGATAFFCQSGALGTSLLENVARRGLGLSSFVSAGNRGDISGNDMLQYWEDDPGTSSVMLYLESIGNPRKFSRLARRVGRVKPVVAVRSEGVTQGVPLGHTVRRTQLPQAAIQAMYAQAGVIGVENIHEMFDVAQLLAAQPVPSGPGVAIVGNSDALNLLAAAACARYGLTTVGPRIDLTPTATSDELADALAGLDADPEVHSIVVSVARPVDGTIAEHAAEVDRAAARGGRTIVATYVGLDTPVGPAPSSLIHRAATSPGEPAREVDPTDGAVTTGAAATGVPPYQTPEDAVRALAAVTAYGEWRRQSDPGEGELSGIEPATAVALAEEALAGRPAGVDLDAASVGALLATFGIELGREAPVDADARSMVVRTREDPLFGPIVSFGLAGVVSDVLGDVGFAIPPLTEVDARKLLLSLRAAPLLLGHGGRSSLDVDAVARLLVRVGRLAYEVPDIAALDLDPVVVSADGLVVTGAVCRLRSSAARVDRPARSLPAAADLVLVDGAAGENGVPG